MSELEISPEQFRHLANRAVNLAAAYLAALPDARSFPETSGEETERLFGAPLSEAGLGEAALDGAAHMLAHSRPPTGRFFGYVLGSGEPVGAVADLLASVVNQNVTAWRSSPAAVTIERSVVRALATALGCDGFTGSLCGGGSAANLMALAMAREARVPANEDGVRPGVVYASDQIHMSIGKAVALLGLGRHNLRLLPTDDSFRLRTDALSDAMGADTRAGRAAIVVVASAGTVNTGAVDPLPEIAAIARSYGAWLHVDGAYGALAALAEPGRLPGLDLADSLSLDAHKWLYQALDCGCLLYRDADAARRAFSHTGDYARGLSADPLEGFAFFEESMELSRRFRALRLWLSLRYHGMGAFRAAIRTDLEHARALAAAVAARPDLELLAPVELSAVCFRHVGPPTASPEQLDRRNAAILQRVIERGRVYISNATLRGRFALRACFTNHRTTAADVVEIVDEVAGAAVDVARG